ncbi:hypothetical protein DM860_008204 [Cuscuta australis]|uniref:Uncharacterized protein n=1 Tax=Cuscuta australis TaxID=267555 RepID=A0A328D3T8_9ASTE|nr:hypothetical protein DM860_008204 [Cuscuta australis]
MATSLSHSTKTALRSTIHGSSQQSKPKLPSPIITFSLVIKGQLRLKSKHFAKSQPFAYLGHSKNSNFPNISIPGTSRDDDVLETIGEMGFAVEEEKPAKFLLWTLFWASLSLCFFAVSGNSCRRR